MRALGPAGAAVGVVVGGVVVGGAAGEAEGGGRPRSTKGRLLQRRHDGRRCSTAARRSRVRVTGESDHNGSAVALARRSSYLCNNNSPEWLPRNIRATHTLSSGVRMNGCEHGVMKHQLGVFGHHLAGVGRRDGSDCTIIPAVTDVQYLRVYVLTRVENADPPRGDVDHRPVERGWGTETASTGSSLA